VTTPAYCANIVENPGWYTAFRPYQSRPRRQAVIEALLNFQTM